MSEQAADPNAHIRGYLKHYIGLQTAPNYAVMLEGPWGIGKTFLVKQLLSELISKPRKYVYVSLYGLSSPEQLDDALFGAFYEILDSFGGKIATGVLRGTLRAFRFDPDFKRGDFLQKCNADLYVFDDLERCNMPVKQVLGHINQVVEHAGGKVVILANEEQIEKATEYLEVKEKVVGKTLTVQPVFDAALAHFLGEIQSANAKQFLADNAPAIQQSFDLSETQNFRILQQTLWDFERLYEALAPKLTARAEDMQTLLAYFLAYSFELKSGKLAHEHVRRSGSKFEDIFDSLATSDSKPKQPHRDLAEKYQFDSRNRVELAGPLWTKILLDGMINQDSVSAALEWLGWFADPSDQPAWKTIWNRYFHTTQEVQAAIKIVLGQLRSKEITQAGEILHIFGLFVELAAIKAIPCSKQSVLKRGQQYVDSLRAGRMLELPPDFEHQDEIRYGAYGGYGFSASKEPEFAEFMKYLKLSRQKAKADLYEEQAQDLLQELRSNPDNFCASINEIGEPIGKFARVPVLSRIDQTAFVDALFNLHPRQQDAVLIHLYRRYDNAYLFQHLSDERAWAQGLIDELRSRAEKASSLDRDRIKFAVDYYFKRVPNGDLDEQDDAD